MLEVHCQPAFADNYIWLIHELEAGITAAVDPGAAEPVLSALISKGWSLDYILNTHHHSDHIGGNLELKARTGCRIVGSGPDRQRIPGLDLGLADGDRFALGNATAAILEVPGHTRGHIAFWFESERALFCGDTLFALGCGRLFEGSAQEMWNSLSRLRQLPEDTRIYCAHEYTLANSRFALSVDPHNETLARRAVEIAELRRQGQATVPSLLALERATNPFLRPDDKDIRRSVGMENAESGQVFAKLRQLKDGFSG